MKIKNQISIPELALLVGTRALAGAGVALLLGNRLKEDQRKAVGWSLFLIGAMTTVPLALEIFTTQKDSDTPLSLRKVA